MKTIKQLLSNYLHERRDLITAAIKDRRVLFFIRLGVALIVLFNALIILHLFHINVSFRELIGISVLGYLAWIVFLRKVK